MFGAGRLDQKVTLACPGAMEHRAGKLKQSNKKHKVSAASKRALDRRNHGRMNRPAPKAASR